MLDPNIKSHLPQLTSFTPWGHKAPLIFLLPALLCFPPLYAKGKGYCVYVCESAYASAHISIIPIISFPTYPNVTTSFLQMSSWVCDLWIYVCLLYMHLCWGVRAFHSLSACACMWVSEHCTCEFATRSWWSLALLRSQWSCSPSSEGRRLAPVSISGRSSKSVEEKRLAPVKAGQIPC